MVAALRAATTIQRGGFIMFDEENINAYIGGILLGIVLLVIFSVFGRGLGASGAPR